MGTGQPAFFQNQAVTYNLHMLPIKEEMEFCQYSKNKAKASMKAVYHLHQ